MLLLSAADFFKINFFQKIISGALSECQTVWIQIRTDVLSVLIWIKNVCKSYQHTTKDAASKERVKVQEELPVSIHFDGIESQNYKVHKSERGCIFATVTNV